MFPIYKFIKTISGSEDHPPSNQNRVLRGSSSAGNARSAETSLEESVIHQVEKEAYSCVLRAFKYQSIDLSWVYMQLLPFLLYMIFVVFCFED